MAGYDLVIPMIEKEHFNNDKLQWLLKTSHKIFVIPWNRMAEEKEVEEQKQDVVREGEYGVRGGGWGEGEWGGGWTGEGGGWGGAGRREAGWARKEEENEGEDCGGKRMKLRKERKKRMLNFGWPSIN